jgi:hypothetical protein
MILRINSDYFPKYDQPINLCNGDAVYSENHTKLIYTPCRKNAELMIAIAGGIYSYHWAVKG